MARYWIPTNIHAPSANKRGDEDNPFRYKKKAAKKTTQKINGFKGFTKMNKIK